MLPRFAPLLLAVSASTFGAIPAIAVENPNPTPHCALTTGWKGGCEHLEVKDLKVISYGRALLNRVFISREELALSETSKRQVSAKIRAGMFEEVVGADGACKGTVIFLEGFGGSIQNHVLLFRAIADTGYRVVSFDYLGQGGSTGDMDNMRIENIPDIAEQVYQHYTKREKRACSKKIVAGWSSGGIAAWYWGANQRVPLTRKVTNQGIAALILLNPSIVAKPLPGETKLPYTLAHFDLKTLANMTEEEAKGIWLDPIFPDSPLQTPALDVSLIVNGQLADFHSRGVTAWSFPKEMKGLAIIGGHDDSYIDNDKIAADMPFIAPGFEVRRYSDALHSLDNALPVIRERTFRDVVDFLSRLK